MREMRRLSRWGIACFIGAAALVGIGVVVRLAHRGAAPSEFDAAALPSDEASRPEREVVRRAAAIRGSKGDGVGAVGEHENTAAIASKLTGRVVAGGSGVSCASIRLYRLNDDGQTVASLPLKVTDQDGAYAIVASPARYWIVATSPNGWTGSLEVLVPSTGASLEVPELEISRGASISGTLRWHGKPRSRYVVTCRPAAAPESQSGLLGISEGVDADRIAHESALTDNEGHYELKGLPPGLYLVEATIPTSSSEVFPLAKSSLGVFARAPATDVDFDFVDCAVTFEFESSAIELGRVSCEIHSSEGGLVTGGTAVRRSKEPSEAEPCRLFLSLPPGRQYEIVAVSERHLRKNLAFSVPANAKAMTVHVSLEKREHFGSLSIRFGGSGDVVPETASFRLSPLVDVATTVRDPSAVARSETLQRQATAFSLPVKEGVALWSEVDLAAGRYRLETMVAVRPKSDSTFLPVEVDVVPGDTTNVTVPIGTGGFLDVTVRDALATPLSARCFVKNASGRVLPVGFAHEARLGSSIILSGVEPPMTPRLESGGEVRLAVPLPAGRYTLRVEHQDYETLELPFEIVSSQSTKVEAVLRKAKN